MGTKFIKADLIQVVGNNFDGRIAKAEAKLDAIKNKDYDAAHRAWRQEAEDAIDDLHERIHGGLATDSELSRFSISLPPYPSDSKWEVDYAQEQVDSIRAAKQKAINFVRALAPIQTDRKDVEIVDVTAVDLKRIWYGA